MRADGLPHADVVVRVNGEALTEHQTENEALTATTFIEAIPGAHFWVELKLEAGFAYRDPNDKLRFTVHVDGECARSSMFHTHYSPESIHINEGAVATLDGVSTLRRYTFAAHASSDEKADISDLEKLANMGEVKVELRRCRTQQDSNQNHSISFQGVGRDQIPEKAMKGRSISSHTKLGESEATTRVKWVHATYPHGKDPIVTYIFQYRSRRDLEVEGIVERPRSPTPPVPLEDRDPDELTPEELRQQVRLLRASQVKVKQEFKREKRARESSSTAGNGEDDDDGDITMTSHSDRRKRARASVGGDEVVDLTDD